MGTTKENAASVGTKAVSVKKTNKTARAVAPDKKKTSAIRKPAQASKSSLAKGADKKRPKDQRTPALDKPSKLKKPKMVRDSLAMPKQEYEVLSALKLRAAKLALPAKKTELIRAGIKALAAMPDNAFLVAIRAVPNLKTGRPVKTA